MTKDVEQNRRAKTSPNIVALKRRALQMGFDAVGVAALEPNAHAAELDRWLAAGYAGTMTYLHRQSAKRKQPARIMPGAKVAVVTLTNYFHDPGPPARGQPRVAQYAQSADYHRVLGRRLERLAGEIREVAPGAKTRCYVDAGPVPERELAPRSELAAPDAREFLALDEETFARRYGDTPFERPGREGMRRNAAAARAGKTT